MRFSKSTRSSGWAAARPRRASGMTVAGSLMSFFIGGSSLGCRAGDLPKDTLRRAEAAQPALDRHPPRPAAPGTPFGIVERRLRLCPGVSRCSRRSVPGDPPCLRPARARASIDRFSGPEPDEFWHVLLLMRGLRGAKELSRAAIRVLLLGRFGADARRIPPLP